MDSNNEEDINVIDITNSIEKGGKELKYNENDTDISVLNIENCTTQLDEWLEMLAEMSFSVKEYCEENNLPIFNKSDIHDIVFDYFNH
jgi:hypothetical protein